MKSAVLLVSHGTVDNLDDLAAFVQSVRHGRPAGAGVVAELRRRYEAIGGRSPLDATSAELARKLGARLGVRTAWASRLWKPPVRDVVAGLAREGVHQVAVVPLAPWSAHVYEDDARRAVEGTGIRLACSAGWGQSARLGAAFAARIDETLAACSAPDRTTLLFTAHSLPRSSIDAGDPYEREFRATIDAVVASSNRARRVHRAVAFQSQGIGSGVEWLGPDVPAALDQARARGDAHVVFASIGFLADHVETLYDLDIEARAMAAQRGLGYARARSLDASDDLVEALADVARPLLGA